MINLGIPINFKNYYYLKDKKKQFYQNFLDNNKIKNLLSINKSIVMVKRYQTIN